VVVVDKVQVLVELELLTKVMLVVLVEPHQVFMQLQVVVVLEQLAQMVTPQLVVAQVVLAWQFLLFLLQLKQV
jgi:hypothetical protein